MQIAPRREIICSLIFKNIQLPPSMEYNLEWPLLERRSTWMVLISYVSFIPATMTSLFISTEGLEHG